MGCDIHLYIEYRKPFDSTGYRNNWKSFGGRINPGRNYIIFSLLAGIRNYNELPILVPPRGMPEDAGYYADNENRMYISEDSQENSVTMERAQTWVDQGSSKFVYRDNDIPRWVTHPDWHSHSWLTTKEFAAALGEYVEVEPEYEAVLASMKKFEELGFEARIVFWFDN